MRRTVASLASGARRWSPRPPALAPTLRGYRPRWLAGDVLAAVTLLVIAVPEQLATSRLAQMPPITGFYAFIAGSVMFALLGTNARVSVGADSTIAPLFAAGITALAGTEAAHGADYAEMAALVAVLAGALVALVWALRLGWVAEFLSAPIISGFLAGIAVVIVVHQLPDVLGLETVGGGTLHRAAHAFGHLGQAHVWPLVVALLVLSLVTGAQRLDRRLPGALVALVAATALVALAHLGRHGVAVLGAVAHGAPHFGLTHLSWALVGSLMPIAAVVAIVIVTQTAATTRAFPGPDGDEPHVGRDLLAVGAGNVLAGVAGAFAVDASPPRSAAVDAAGGRSQLSSLLAAGALAALTPAAAVLHDVPLAALAGVLLFIAVRLFNVRGLIAIARYDVAELGLALVTLLVVALVGVEQGIAVAVGLAIVDRARRTARPQLHVLGRIPGTTSWAPVHIVEAAERVPGTLVVLFATPLWYANAVHFRSELRSALAGAAPERVTVVVLDALGMSDIDYTGAQALGRVLDDLARARITFAIARAGDTIREELRRGGLLARIGEAHLYPAVDIAVEALRPQKMGG